MCEAVYEHCKRLRLDWKEPLDPQAQTKTPHHRPTMVLPLQHCLLMNHNINNITIAELDLKALAAAATNL
jgi:hypothetical protein